MNDYNLWLENQIMNFMTVVEDCLHSTIYANDRSVYKQDIGLIAKWLTSLHKGVSAKEIANEIINVQTDKYFGDYWRQGIWGEKEMNALKNLQKEIRSHIES